MTIDQSITNTGWNLFLDKELLAFGSFGSEMGKNNKIERGYVAFHERANFIGQGEIHFERNLIPKDKTNTFMRIRHSSERFKEIIEVIESTYTTIDHFVFEDLAYGANGNATRDLAGILFTYLTRVEFERYSLVSIKTAKKIFTGSGNAKKLDMINALPESVRQLYLDAGFEYSKVNGSGQVDDLADSYSFYQWYLQK